MKNRNTLLNFRRFSLISLALVFVLSNMAMAQKKDIQSVNEGFKPEKVWEKFLEKNRVWIDPQVDTLFYTLNIWNPQKGKEEITTSKLWLSGKKVRWETTAKFGDSNPDNQYKFICLEDIEYCFFPDKIETRSPLLSSVNSFKQGISWYTGIHVLAKNGLPESARIIDLKQTENGEVLILEADTGNKKVRTGLGLICIHFGAYTFPLHHIRLHIRIPDYLPVLEEHFNDKGEKMGQVEFGTEFIDFGEQKAPKILRYVLEGPVFNRKWSLEARFQKINDIWLLKEGFHYTGADIKNQAIVENVSTQAPDPELFEVMEPNSENSEEKPDE